MAISPLTEHVPPLTLSRQIGGTRFIVSARFSDKATENITQKVRRMIQAEFSKNPSEYL